MRLLKIAFEDAFEEKSPEDFYKLVLQSPKACYDFINEYHLEYLV